MLGVQPPPSSGSPPGFSGQERRSALGKRETGVRGGRLAGA